MFQTVANTRQMVPGKKAKTTSKPQAKKNKTILHPFYGNDFGIYEFWVFPGPMRRDSGGMVACFGSVFLLTKQQEDFMATHFDFWCLRKMEFPYLVNHAL